MGILALCIRRESPGPAIFTQKRPGRDGKVFALYKMRSMRVACSRDGKPLTDMERMTRVGAFMRSCSLDELPQLFNVLRGEMSFIGPRPLLEQYMNLYTPRQKRRHELRPGISGWAQANGRNAITWEEKFELDIYYVDNLSFALDCKILCMTVKNVLKRSGVNASEANTMDFFTGADKK